jgi:hypothetical protein
MISSAHFNGSHFSVVGAGLILRGNYATSIVDTEESINSKGWN